MQRHVYRRVVHNRLSLHGGLAGALRRSLSAPLAPLVRAARRPAGAARHHPRACSPRACPKRLLPARLLSAHPLPLARSSTRCAPARCAPARLAAVELLMDCRGGWGGGGDLRWLLAGGAAKVEDSRCLPACGPRRRAAAQHVLAVWSRNFSRSAAWKSFDTATAFGDPALNTVHASHGQPERASHGRSRRKLNLRQRCG